MREVDGIVMQAFCLIEDISEVSYGRTSLHPSEKAC